MRQYSNNDDMIDDKRIRKNHLTERQSIEFVEYLNHHITNDEFDIHDTFKEPKKYYTIYNENRKEEYMCCKSCMISFNNNIEKIIAVHV